MGRKLLYGNDNIRNKEHYNVGSNTHFFENTKVFCSVDKYHYQPPLSYRNTYNNALNIIRDLCCCKQNVYRVFECAFPSFLARSRGGVVVDRVLQSFKPTGC